MADSTSSKSPTNIQDARRSKIQDALKVLEDSAKEFGDDFTALLKEKYHSIEGAAEVILGESYKELRTRTQDAAEKSKKMARETARAADSHVHENPWAYIMGGVTAGTLIGFMLGKK